MSIDPKRLGPVEATPDQFIAILELESRPTDLEAALLERSARWKDAGIDQVRVVLDPDPEVDRPGPPFIELRASEGKGLTNVSRLMYEDELLLDIEREAAEREAKAAKVRLVMAAGLASYGVETTQPEFPQGDPEEPFI